MTVQQYREYEANLNAVDDAEPGDPFDFMDF